MREWGESLCSAWESNHDMFKGKRSPRIFILSLNNGTNMCIPNFSIYIKRSEEYTYLIPGNFTFLFYTHVYYLNFNSTFFFTFSNSIMIKVITKRVIAQRITGEETLVHVIILWGLSPQLNVSSLVAGASSYSSACRQCPTLALTHGGCTGCTYWI